VSGQYGRLSYLNDCPQRSVVLMQSSDRLTGSFCHPARSSAPIASQGVYTRSYSKVAHHKLRTTSTTTSKQSRLGRVAGSPVKWCRQVGISARTAPTATTNVHGGMPRLVCHDD